MLLQRHTQENLYIAGILRKNYQILLFSNRFLHSLRSVEMTESYLYRHFKAIDAACYPAGCG